MGREKYPLSYINREFRPTIAATDREKLTMTHIHATFLPNRNQGEKRGGAKNGKVRSCFFSATIAASTGESVSSWQMKPTIYRVLLNLFQFHSPLPFSFTLLRMYGQCDNHHSTGGPQKNRTHKNFIKSYKNPVSFKHFAVF